MGKNFLTVLLIIIGFIILPFNINNYALDEIPDDEINLYLGEVKIIPVRNPSRIIIGNPNIVDVTNVTTTEMTLNPKGTGTTNLVFWDNFGEQSYQVNVFTENMNELKRRIDNLLKKLDVPDVYTQAAETEGKILILGKVKTPEERERISLALGTLKEKTIDLILLKEEESAVEIDVRVLELDKDATKTLGFTWPGSTAITVTEASAPAGVAISRLFTVGSLSRSAFSWTLDALVKEGKARILSRPRLACQSGKEAVLLVGGEKPIFTTEVAATTGAQGTNVEYKEYGISLKIKPTITKDKQIKVALGVEISEVGTAEYIGAAANRTAQAYPLTKRNASTELYLNDGQTLAIGGLIKQKTEETIQKVPFLGDIPLIGTIFRYKQTKVGGGYGEKGNTELFITLTPKIIADRETLALQAKKENVQPELIANPALEKGDLESLTDYMTVMDYANIVQKRILESLRYPLSAKEAGLQGTLKLKLHLSYLGELLDIELKSSSGYKILDDNAFSVAKEIVPYPPFPPSIDKEDLWVEVPIIYRLN